MDAQRPPRRWHLTILLVGLLVAAAKGLVAAWVTPAFQTPDEYGHYDYVLYLSHIHWSEFLAGRVARPTAYNDVTTSELWAVTRATGTESHLRGTGLRKPLPTLRAQVVAASAFAPVDTHGALKQKVVVAPQFNYPILYYGGMALLVKALRTAGVDNPVVAYYVVRGCSLVLLLATIACVWTMLAAAFPDEADVLAVAGGTWFVALQPQLTMLATSVQSDMLTIVLTTAAIGLGARAGRQDGRPIGLAAGLLCGLLLLTKLHAAAAALAGLTGLVVVLGVLGRSPRFAADVARMWTLAGLIGGWWYVRSYLLYGSYTGMVGQFRTAGFGSRRANLRGWIGQWPLTYESFWGIWGWLEVPLPTWMYVMLGCVAIVTVALACRRAVDGAHTRALTLLSVNAAGIALAYAGVMAVVAVVVGPFHNNQGRHWLPLVAAVALVVAVASKGRAGRKGRGGLVLAWCVVLLVANGLLIERMLRFYW